jgi:hypothetical protein
MPLERISRTCFNLIHRKNLVYNQCWEDPRLDRAALELSGDDRVLVITSAGCNALDYALAGAGHVHAVDMNFRQNALLELKQSAIRNLDYGDRDSLGIFQMRPSMGWGTPAQVTNPPYQVNKFYDVLEGVPDWETRRPGDVAQAVERSAFPDRYHEWESMAVHLIENIGQVEDASGCGEGAGDELPPNDAAETAIQFALGERGKPYVWGATGPDSYDCSGLLLRAFEAAGVTLMPEGGSDASSVVAAATRSVDAVAMMTTTPATTQYLAARSSVGDSTPTATGVINLPKALIGELGAAVEDIFLTSPVMPIDADVEGVTQLRQTAETAGLDPDAWAYPEYVTLVWANVQVFVAAAEQADELSAAGIHESLGNLQVDVGVIAPVDLTAPRSDLYPGLDRIFNNEMLFGDVRDGRFEPFELTWVDPSASELAVTVP